MHPAKVFYEQPIVDIDEINENQKVVSSTNGSLGISKFFISTVTSQSYKAAILASYAKEHETPSPGTGDSAAVVGTSAEEHTDSEQTYTDDSEYSSESDVEKSSCSSGYNQLEVVKSLEIERFKKKSISRAEDCKRKNLNYEKKFKQQFKPDSTALNQFIQLLQAEEFTTTDSKDDTFISDLRSKVSSSSSSGSRSVEDENSHSNEYSVFELIDVEDCWASWDYENQSTKLTLLENIKYRLSEHPKNNITTVSFGRIHFKCHRLVLRFAKFFRLSDHKSYQFPAEHHLTAIAFMIFYQFAMGFKPSIDADYFLDVLRAADVLNVEALQLYCTKLLDSDLYHEYNAFKVYRAAKRHQNVGMQRLMLQRIWRFFMPFVATKYFLEMDVQDVCSFLEADTVGVNSEIEIFYAAVLWLNAKWKKRRGKILERVMSCVRYGLLPPWFTYSLKRGTGIVEVDRVLESKFVGKMIEDGASIAATIGLYFVEPSKFESILHRLLPKVPKQRNWVFDRNSTYHYGAHDKVSEAVDFIVFKDYLKILELEGQNYWRNFQEAENDHLVQVFSQKFSDLAWSKMQL